MCPCPYYIFFTSFWSFQIEKCTKFVVRSGDEGDQHMSGRALERVGGFKRGLTNVVLDFITGHWYTRTLVQDSWGNQVKFQAPSPLLGWFPKVYPVLSSEVSPEICFKSKNLVKCFGPRLLLWTCALFLCQGQDFQLGL